MLRQVCNNETHVEDKQFILTLDDDFNVLRAVERWMLLARQLREYPKAG